MSEVGLNFEQSWTRVAKEPNALRIGAHIAMQVGKDNQFCVRELWQRSASTINRGSFFWHDRHKATTIARILEQESQPASREGIQKFLKKYIESGAIGRQECSGRKLKITEVRRLVHKKMMEDDETSAKELKKMLAEHGHHVSETTALKCRTEIGRTHRGSAYCQMICEVNKGKKLE